MDRLKVLGHAPNSFPEFEKLFINKHAPINDKNVARDILHELRQCGSMQEYITMFNNMVVALPDLGREDAINTFVYGLRPHLKEHSDPL